MKSILKSILVLLVCVLFIIPMASYANQQKCRIMVNQKELVTSVPPFNMNGRIMVPFRDIFEALGVAVQWDPGTKTVIGKKDSQRIELKINSKTAKVNGVAVSLDVPPVIHQKRCVVPLRFIAEALNMDVNWDVQTGTVIINNKLSNVKEKPSSTVTPAQTPAATLFATPSPMVEPMPAEIKVFSGDKEFAYKAVGGKIRIQNGKLLGDTTFCFFILPVRAMDDRLVYYSGGDFKSLETRMIDNTWVPIMEVAKELNIQAEYKNNTLYINGSSKKNQYFLDGNIPVTLSMDYSSRPIAMHDGVTVLSITTARMYVNINRQEDYQRLKSLDDMAVKKILYDFIQNNNGTLKACDRIECNVYYAGVKYYEMSYAQGQSMDKVWFQGSGTAN